MWLVPRKYLLLVCFALCLLPLYCETLIPVPASELSWMRSELSTCQQNLRNRDKEILRLSQVSDGSRRLLASTLEDSKELQNRINKLLTDSVVSEEAYKKMMNDYSEYLIQSTEDLQRVRAKLRRTRIALSAAVFTTIVEAILIRILIK